MRPAWSLTAMPFDRRVPVYRRRSGGVVTGLLLALVLLLPACADRGRPVVVDQAQRRSPVLVVRDGDVRTLGREPGRDGRGVYVVAKGDTLYRIAWRFGTTVETLARRNGLRPPYTIYPGQQLRVTAAAIGRGGDQPARTGKPPPHPPAAEPAVPAGAIGWRWPTTVTPAREFGRDNKGLDFELPPASRVTAAGHGVVVYSGVGLGGYDSLLIIRHSSGYLSAYSLNAALLAEEGDVLKAGDVVADMGGSGRAARFHFEIRKDGEPVSPRKLLR